jgi:hypothetical protein
MNIVSSWADRRRRRLCRFAASPLKKKNKRVLYCRRRACRDCCVFCNKYLETLLLLFFPSLLIFSQPEFLLKFIKNFSCNLFEFREFQENGFEHCGSGGRDCIGHVDSLRAQQQHVSGKSAMEISQSCESPGSGRSPASA